jgi:predicted O-methyltransferase YrrM
MPEFTSDWFDHDVAKCSIVWACHVLPHLRPLPVVNWLEIGSFEGRSALWIAENLLAAKPGSKLVCVDVFHPSYASRFDANLAGIPFLEKRQGRSRNVLRTLPRGFFNGAYVDGSHVGIDVLMDARMVLPLLAPGAILIFDDYNTDGFRGEWLEVKPAVDAFLRENPGRFMVLHRAWQMILRATGI